MQCKNEKRWNIFFFFLYIAIAAELILILDTTRGTLPTSISLFDLVLIILAVFRLVRLFVYDRITKFIRDWFEETPSAHIHGASENSPVCACDLPDPRTNTQAQNHNQGNGATDENEEGCYRSGFNAAVSHLLSCPWCMGIWIALPITFFYFATPIAWFPILIIAIGGVSSLLQLIANMIGWSAENLKRKAQ